MHILTTVANSATLCITHHKTLPTMRYASNNPAGPAFAYAAPVPMNNPVPIPEQNPIMVTW